MVPRKQLAVIVSMSVVSLVGPPAFAGDAGKKFYTDDPLWKEPAPRPVKQVVVRKVDDIYDFLENTYVTPQREGRTAKESPRPAVDINTLGEVPDGAWYTNRHWLRRMSIAELMSGPGNSTPPKPNEQWRIVGAKSDGITPGFVIEDSSKNRFLLKLDPPDYPELCSAADVIGSKFFYALGYNTPENYIVHFRRENLTIPEGMMWRDSTGRQRRLTQRVLDDMLRPQRTNADQTYRALASRWVPGKVVGPFSYRGTRTDDPNDTIPHEDRRVLRGLAVFSAWLNHHDTRSINSMDTLVTEDARQSIRHYLIDFGSTLGSAGDRPKDPWIGHEHYIANKEAAVQAVTLGIYTPRWMRSDYPKLTGAGLLDSWSFDPITWKPNYPNPAFLMLDNQDAFWAAKQVAAFTDEEIRAIVSTGEFSDPKAADWVTTCLIERRDKIAQAWFSQVLPLDKFRVDNGMLAFDDVSLRGESIPPAYEVRWSVFDNDRALLTALDGAIGPEIPRTETRAEYLAATITRHGESACPHHVKVYLRRSGSTFSIVGIDR